MAARGLYKHTQCFRTQIFGLHKSELFYFSSCRVILQWCTWTDFSPFGMCPGTVWSVLANVCLDVLHPVAYPKFNSQEACGRH
ncbi:Outer capsid protein P8 [Labeo rohita]|uniref:Outer capsid protein P8 n=1 Tax=Labeo rohita TaxID=84645 RepID=A0ABQ8MWP2_LABRO|nr:Outer capsid protein P8 [Labeo rohita]